MNLNENLIFELESSANKNYLITYMNADDNIIEYEMEMINNNTSCGAISLETRQFNDKVKVLYDITGKISLMDYLKNNSIKKGEFLTLLRNISRVVLECKDYFLDKNKYFMNLEYIYVSPIDLGINLIYVPLERIFSDECGLKYRDIVIKIILDYTNFQDQENDDIVQKILNYLRNNWVSITDFNKFLEEFRQENVKVFYGTAGTKVPEIIKEAVEQEIIPPVLASKKRNNIFTTFFNKFKKKDKNVTKKKDNKKVNSRSADTGLINSSKVSAPKREIMTEMSYDTVLLDSKVAYLLSKKSGTVERIYINKEVFKIGRLPGEVDYLTDNKAIGKIHLELRTSSSKYYVFDLNSKNGTFINSKKLEPNKEYEIKNKDILMLANSEFTFQIE